MSHSDDVAELLDGDTFYRNRGSKEEPVWERVGPPPLSAIVEMLERQRRYEHSERLGAQAASRLFKVRDVQGRRRLPIKTPEDLTDAELADFIEWEDRVLKRQEAIDELAKRSPGFACYQSAFDGEPCPVPFSWVFGGK